MSKLQDDIRALCDLSVPAPGLEPLSPTGGPLSPEPKSVYHDDFCCCESCADIRASMDLYLSAKRNYNVNNWWAS